MTDTARLRAFIVALIGAPHPGAIAWATLAPEMAAELLRADFGIDRTPAPLLDPSPEGRLRAWIATALGQPEAAIDYAALDSAAAELLIEAWEAGAH